jgi:hypothetical protein
MIQGALLTRDFLLEGIKETSAWGAQSEASLAALRARVVKRFADFVGIKNPNEAVTEKNLIYPVLNDLGWNDLVLVQQTLAVKGRDDVPDALLFGDEESYERA